MRSYPSFRRAFSLLELLAVIMIIGIVAVFVTPAASTILKGSQLSQAEQILTDQIKLARQQAVTKNRSIQVRFIRYGDNESVGEKTTDPKTGSYRAIQLFEVLENGAIVPLDKPQILPQSVVIASNELSTLVSVGQTPVTAQKSRTATGGGDPALPRGVEYNYEFVSFRFLPDGSTNLNSTSGTVWCVTLHNVNDKAKAGSSGVVNGAGQGINFVTLQLDPVSGTVRMFRPSV